MGTALWFPMYGLEDADEATFQAKIDPIVKAIGDQGQVKHSGGDLSEDATLAFERVAGAIKIFDEVEEYVPIRDRHDWSVRARGRARRGEN